MCNLLYIIKTPALWRPQWFVSVTDGRSSLDNLACVHVGFLSLPCPQSPGLRKCVPRGRRGLTSLLRAVTRPLRLITRPAVVNQLSLPVGGMCASCIRLVSLLIVDFCGISFFFQEDQVEKRVGEHHKRTESHHGVHGEQRTSTIGNYTYCWIVGLTFCTVNKRTVFAF